MQQITITGRLTRDAEVRRISGRDVLAYTVECHEQSPEGEVITYYSCFDRASGAVESLTEGCSVSVCGSLSLREQTRGGKIYLSASIRVSSCEVQSFRRTNHEIEFARI